MKHSMYQIVDKRIVDSHSLDYFVWFLCRGPKIWGTSSRKANSYYQIMFFWRKNSEETKQFR